MIFQFPTVWCLAVALLVSQSSVQCNDKETTHNQAKRTKRDHVSTFGKDFSQQNQFDVPYSQLGSQSTWPMEDLSKSENLGTSYSPNLFGKQSGDNYLSLLLPTHQYENLLSSPKDRPSGRLFRQRYYFLGKRDPEIDANDRPDLNQFEIDDEDSDDSIDLLRRRAPQFSHNFIGKRQQPRTDNNNIYKRKGTQFFARRAPHFTHSFVGKRSDNEAGYNNNGISFGVPDSYPYNNLETGSSSWLPLNNQHFLEGSNFGNFKSPLLFPDIPSVHYLVKRASDMEKRGPSFGHSFVGKRAPRFGHSFVGKREDDDVDFIEKALLSNDFEDELNYPLVPEEIAGQNEAGFDTDYSEDTDVSAVKRQQRPSQNPSTFLGKRPSFTHSYVGKRAPGFGHSFVGKRGPSFGHSFVGKRAPGFGHSFVGKRGPSFGHSFVGKRAPGFGHSFVGKRGPSFGHSFVGKRAPGFGHSFVGKRGPSFGHSFVGKRAPGFGHSFVGKRGPSFGHSFVGKRAPGFGHSFVGKRGPSFGHSFVGKRAPGFGHSFVGKRPGFSHSFVGKRDEDSDYILPENPEDNLEFDSTEQENEESISGDSFQEPAIVTEQNVTDVSLKETVEESKVDTLQISSPEAVKTEEISPDMEKRAPRFGHSFVGKRAPGFGHSFVGKRAPRFGHSFVGKRAPQFGHSFVGKRVPGFGHSFVGKREDLTTVDQNNLVEGSLTHDDTVKLVDFFQTDRNGKDPSGDTAYTDNSSKTSNL